MMINSALRLRWIPETAKAAGGEGQALELQTHLRSSQCSCKAGSLTRDYHQSCTLLFFHNLDLAGWRVAAES